MMSPVLMSPRALLPAVVLLACAGAHQGVRSSPLVGQAFEVAAEDLKGRVVRVNAAAGQVRVVDFWATWCDPCRDQLPFLDRLSADHGPLGLSIYAISFDEDRAALERFLEETPVSFAILWDKGGAALSERLEITRLPTTVIVDRKGVVREVHLGFDRDEEKKIEAIVRRLLAEDGS